MASQIVFAIVRLGFDDHPALDAIVRKSTHKVLAQKPAGERKRFFPLE
jgi:hypothetical protein